MKTGSGQHGAGEHSKRDRAKTGESCTSIAHKRTNGGRVAAKGGGGRGSGAINRCHHCAVSPTSAAQ